MPTSWSKLSESSSSDEEASQGQHSRSRSRSPAKVLHWEAIFGSDDEIGDAGSNNAAATFVPSSRPGLGWWAEPMLQGIRGSSSKDTLNKRPKRAMVHMSGCSGMMTEMFAAEATY